MFLEKKPTIPHTPYELLGSLLRQLVRFKKFSISIGIKDAYKEHKDALLLRRDLEALLKVNPPRKSDGLADRWDKQAEIEPYERIHLVVDGLDEASDETRRFLERTLRALFFGRLRLMTTASKDTRNSL
jgi:hypothetical protein